MLKEIKNDLRKMRRGKRSIDDFLVDLMDVLAEKTPSREEEQADVEPRGSY
jgi:hypothetical protein